MRTDSEITGRRISKRLDNNGSQMNCLIKQIVITIINAIKHDNATYADMFLYRDGDDDDDDDLLFMEKPTTTKKSTDRSLVILHMFYSNAFKRK